MPRWTTPWTSPGPRSGSGGPAEHDAPVLRSEGRTHRGCGFGVARVVAAQDEDVPRRQVFGIDGRRDCAGIHHIEAQRQEQVACEVCPGACMARWTERHERHRGARLGALRPCPQLLETTAVGCGDRREAVLVEDALGRPGRRGQLGQCRVGCRGIERVVEEPIGRVAPDGLDRGLGTRLVPRGKAVEMTFEQELAGVGPGLGARVSSEVRVGEPAHTDQRPATRAECAVPIALAVLQHVGQQAIAGGLDEAPLLLDLLDPAPRAARNLVRQLFDRSAPAGRVGDAAEHGLLTKEQDLVPGEVRGRVVFGVFVPRRAQDTVRAADRSGERGQRGPDEVGSLVEVLGAEAAARHREDGRDRGIRGCTE
ncbi:MAG: hypothetical protein RL562_16 [Planctomycetota bacterium]